MKRTTLAYVLLALLGACSVVNDTSAIEVRNQLATWKQQADFASRAQLDATQRTAYEEARALVNTWVEVQKTALAVAATAWFTKVDYLEEPQGYQQHLVAPVTTRLALLPKASAGASKTLEVAEIMALLKELLALYKDARVKDAAAESARLDLLKWHAIIPPK